MIAKTEESSRGWLTCTSSIESNEHKPLRQRALTFSEAASVSNSKLESNVIARSAYLDGFTVTIGGRAYVRGIESQIRQWLGLRLRLWRSIRWSRARRKQDQPTIHHIPADSQQQFTTSQLTANTQPIYLPKIGILKIIRE